MRMTTPAIFPAPRTTPGTASPSIPTYDQFAGTAVDDSADPFGPLPDDEPEHVWNDEQGFYEQVSHTHTPLPGIPGYAPPSIADNTVSPALVDKLVQLGDAYGPAGVRSVVDELWTAPEATAVVVPAFDTGEKYDRPNYRRDVLLTAESLVNGDRNAQYGDPRQDFQRTADLWSTYLSLGEGMELAAHDVAVMMALLKISRIAWSPEKEDSWVDLAGYAACGWDCVAP